MTYSKKIKRASKTQKTSPETIRTESQEPETTNDVNQTQGIPESSSPIDDTASTEIKSEDGSIENKENPAKLTIENLIHAFFNGYGKDSSDENKKVFNEVLKKYLDQLVQTYNFEKKYNILILHDDSTLIKSDADKIYSAVTSFTEERPILMVLLSRGGASGPAYLIGKLCQEYSKGNFIVTVPRHAKSAATLISCAGNEIHMGSMSELGPVDPQINNMPALGLKNSIEHIAGLVKKYPDSSDMFAKYLNLSIEPIQIGYYERVAESAMQYTENLLMTHPQTLERQAKEIANDLVYKYKDHGFVIEKTEASKIFGNKIIRNNTPEYLFGNEIYVTLNLVGSMADYLNCSFYFIGSISAEPNITKRKER
jgi:ClpP class serine protease